MINKRLASTLVALVTVVLSVFVSLPAHAQDEVMTQETAGDYYLSHMCRFGLAQHRYVDQVTWNGSVVRFTDVRKNFPRLKREATRYGLAQMRWATKLLNPPAPWPAEVAGLVEVVADIQLRSGTVSSDADNATTPYGWWRDFGRANAILEAMGNRETKIRVLLNLDPGSRDC